MASILTSKMAALVPMCTLHPVKRGEKDMESQFLLFFKCKAQKVQHYFCLHLIGQNLVTWTYLAARESGECSPKLGGQVPVNTWGFYY